MKRSKRHWFRFAAILLGLLPLVLLEGALRLVDWPRQAMRDDPLIDLHSLRPLFTVTNDGRERWIDDSRRNWFDEDRFPIRKDASTRRIFVLGGSTVQGEPYHRQSAFPMWLQLQLEAVDPSHRYEVINCGGISYASYRVAAILREVLEYSPDLIILYSGHNEFLEDRAYASWKRLPSPVATTMGHLSQLRLVQAGRTLCFKPTEDPRTVMASEVNTRLDDGGGLDAFQRDDAWRSSVITHYQLTMRAMIERCRMANVPCVICVPACNDRDSPPFKISDSPILDGTSLQGFRDAWKRASDTTRTDDQRIEGCREALAIDPHHAGAAYLFGRFLLEKREFAEARRWLTVARDWDVCPLRMPSELGDFLRSLASEPNVTLVDADQLFRQLCKGEIPGDRWFVDHVHPTIPGHQRLAEAIANAISPRWRISMDAAAIERRDTVWRTHMATFDEAYYQHGRQRLEGLKRWAAGNARRNSMSP